MKNYKIYFLSLPVVTLLLMLFNSCSSTTEGLIVNPKAAFTYVLSTENPYEVKFTSNMSDRKSWIWDFGDNRTATIAHPTHIFPREGVYKVTLTATGEPGSTPAVFERDITIILFDPTAEISYTADLLELKFKATTTYARSFLWNFGDGTTSTEKNPSHAYQNEGSYTVTLIATGFEGTTEKVVAQDITVSSSAYISIPLVNGDFQLPGTVKQTNWANVPGWKSDTVAADSGVEGGPSEWTAYRMSNDPSVYNLSPHVIAAGEEFKIKLTAKDGWHSSKIIVTLYFDTGDGVRKTLATQTFDLGPTDPFEVFATATTASVGSKLGVMIDNVSIDSGSAWTGFDNVQMFYK